MTHFSRRDFLVGSAAAGGLALTAASRPAGAGTPASPCNVIIVVAGGGWDTCYALDPKPGSTAIDIPDGQVQRFGDMDIFVHASRPNVTSFFAAYADVTALVRGINIRSIVHPDCLRRLITGTQTTGQSDFGAIVGSELGDALPVPYLVLGPEAYPGPLAGVSASVGFTKQLASLLDPQQAYPIAPAFGSNALDLTANDEAEIRAWVEARAKREQATRGALGYNRRRIDDFLRSVDATDALRDHAGSIGNREPTLGIAEQLTVAVDALHGDLSWSVLVADGQMWDTHAANEAQGGYHDNLFRELAALADDLGARSGRRAGSTMLDETLVVVVSEMSRAPRLNAEGGKEHWPVTTAMLFGGPVAGRTVVGGTDHEQAALAVDLQTGELHPQGSMIQTGHFVATVLDLAGVDPAPWLTDPPLPGLRA